MIIVAKGALIVGAVGFMVAGWAVARTGRVTLGIGYLAIAVANLAFARSL
jgi:hypothetical protein